MLSTVSIMPGIENFAPDRTLTSNGSAGSPSVRPIASSMAARWLVTSRVEAVGRAAVPQVVPAGIGGDGEAGRHGQAEIRHLGEVRPLAAEKVLEVLVTLGEVIHELRHCKLPRAGEVPLRTATAPE